MAAVLECVINISEGRRPAVISEIAACAGPALLDVHVDSDHHRSVLTLAGPSEDLQTAVHRVASVTVALLDLGSHEGAHPRLGVLDVVPFIDLEHPTTVTDKAVGARDRFAAWAGEALALPCFCYGPGYGALPDVRRAAWSTALPDAGPTRPHPTAGATSVGARPVLVAYNLWLAASDVVQARAIAKLARRPAVRALGLDVGRWTQVSCNLIDPLVVGPGDVYDAVAARTEVARAELVGLVPAAVLAAVPPHRWRELGLDPARTIESRLEEAGFDR